MGGKADGCQNRYCATLQIESEATESGLQFRTFEKLGPISTLELTGPASVHCASATSSIPAAHDLNLRILPGKPRRRSLQLPREGGRLVPWQP